MRYALSVEITAVALKLRRKQHGICVIDLLSGVTTTRPRSTNRCVCGLDLVQGSRP
jgi:hypothetical protein